MSDQSIGVVLLLATVLLWMFGNFLQLYMIKRLEKLTDRMRRVPAPQARRGRRRRRRVTAGSPAPEARLREGSPQR
jgi:hypothetical protein